MAQDEDGVMRGTVTDANKNSVNVVIPAKDDVAKNQEPDSAKIAEMDDFVEM